jgi:hypothetical protein
MLIEDDAEATSSHAATIGKVAQQILKQLEVDRGDTTYETVRGVNLSVREWIIVMSGLSTCILSMTDCAGSA